MESSPNSLLNPADFIKRLTPKWTKYIPIRPSAKQTVFLLLDECEEVLYGGSARGGKTDGLLACALQYVDVPYYNAIIFRQTFSDLALADGLIDRSHQWLSDTDAKWNEDRKRWTFPNKSTLNFGYLETPNDRYRYQGTGYQTVCFDELTQHQEICYQYLFSRLCRLAGSQVPIRMRGATNPGGVGHEWVHRRFITEGAQAGRIFVPAGLRDNPFIDQEAYTRSLSNLDSVTREQLLNGNWDAIDSGGKFERAWFDGKIRSKSQIPPLERIVRFWDLAATEPSERNPDPDWTAGVKVGVAENGDLWVLDVRRKRGTPSQIETFIKETAEEDGYEVEVYIEQEPGASGVAVVNHYHRVVLAGFYVKGVRSTGDKSKRANVPSAAAQAGFLYLVRANWNWMFLNEICAYPFGSHDDMLDGLSGASQKVKKKGMAMSVGTHEEFVGPLALPAEEQMIEGTRHYWENG